MVKWICDYCVVMNARWEHTRKQRRRKRNPLSTLSSHVPRGGTTPSVVEMIDFLGMALLLSITCCIKGWNVIESIGLYDTNNKPSSRPAEQPSSGGQAPLPPGLSSARPPPPRAPPPPARCESTRFLPSSRFMVRMSLGMKGKGHVILMIMCTNVRSACIF